MSYLNVLKRKNGRWLVSRATWDTATRKEIRRALTPEEKLLLGFSPTLTLEQARARAKQLNSIDGLSKQEAAARRLNKERLVHETYMPESLANDYEEKALAEHFGAIKTTTKIKSIWRATKRLIIEVRVEPDKAKHKENEIFKWLIAKKFSPAYSQRIISMLNGFCQYVCRQHQQYYEPVKMLKGIAKERLVEAYEDKDTYFGPAGVLTPETLEAHRDSLPKGNYEWLFVSVWLGLRPEEVDNLVKKPQFHRLERSKEGVILWVYQTKLVGVPRKDRWKPIPLIYDEQILALSYIEKIAIKRPILKTLRRAFKERVRLYSGRKGFTDLMLAKGHSLEDISQWMGHLTIDRTWRSYKNRKQIRFPSKAS